MARRRSRRRDDYYDDRGSYDRGADYGRRKSRAEEKVERMTWFLLVLVIALLNFASQDIFPNYMVPFSGAVILLGSGVYQYSNRWRVSPITWIAGTLMLFFSATNLLVDQNANFLGPSLLVFALVILFGVVTGET